MGFIVRLFLHVHDRVALEVGEDANARRHLFGNNRIVAQLLGANE